MMRILSLFALLSWCVLGLAAAGCTEGVLPGGSGEPEWPTVQSDGTLALVAGGYGYEVADIVRIDIGRVPVPGDIVQYDDQLNKSDCGAFGPGLYLANILAVEGDAVTFDECSFGADGRTGMIECGEGIWPRTQGVYWGEVWHEDVAGTTLIVPEGECLADRWIGQEYRQVGSETVMGSRFTVKAGAIIGVILEKLGHDDELQEYLEGIQY